MSVKFEKQQIQTTTPVLRGGRNESLPHKIGERLTGGAQPTGYLAVRFPRRSPVGASRSTHFFNIGIPQAAPVEPAAHQDVDLGYALSSAGAVGLVARP